jgi:O-succinylbenzoate synthase
VQKLTKAELASAIHDSARVVSIPLRTRFRGVTEREALLFEGTNGWAEWAPFLEYGDEEAAVWLSAAIEFAFGDLPEPRRDVIGINATLPAVAPDAIERALAPFGDFRTVKIKVAEAGQQLNQDLARIIKVRQLYPQARIRLDANGGYTVDQAMAVVGMLIENGIALDYFEQPCKTIAELAEVRLKAKRIRPDFLIAADESVRKVSDPLAVAQAGAADLLVLKAAPLGGVSRALSIAADAGLPVVVSSALDTSVGIGMGLALAAALPELEFDCGLGTAAMLIGDVTREPFVAQDGKLAVKRAEVDPAKLEVFAAEDHRVDWWLERLDRCLRMTGV